MLSGKLLVAPPLLDDPNFERSVVYVLAHGADGAIGLVLNRPTRAMKDDLPDALHPWMESSAHPQVLFAGGPVQMDAIIALGLSVGETDGVIETIDLEHDMPDDCSTIRLFRGYSGWSSGQLETELAAGGWLVCDTETSDITTSNPDTLWRTVLARQNGEVRRLAQFPDDPNLN